jgi:hypothetical protein
MRPLTPRTWLLPLILATLAGCAVRTPDSCHKRYVLNHPNRDKFTMCVVRYRVETSTANPSEVAWYERKREEQAEHRRRVMAAIGRGLAKSEESEPEPESAPERTDCFQQGRYTTCQASSGARTQCYTYPNGQISCTTH